MIDYETFCKIKRYRVEEHLTLAQTARALGLHPLTVAKWAGREQYRARRSASRASKLDPFKPDIVRWLETHPLSAAQIFQRLREVGYPGGYTIVKDYVRRVRPRRAPAFLTLAFAPGEAAQVDWGEYGSIALGTTRRRLSFFVMVLCYSRLMYLEFTVSQTMEHFLACQKPCLRGVFGGTLEDHGR
ncbi:MAG: hypothetical protein ACT4QB_09390 [Gammaproteobacteria bacterium]